MIGLRKERAKMRQELRVLLNEIDKGHCVEAQPLPARRRRLVPFLALAPNMLGGVNALPEFLPETLQFQIDRLRRRLEGIAQNLRELLRHRSPFAPGTGLQLPVQPSGRFLTFRVANRVPPLFLHYGGSLPVRCKHGVAWPA